MLKYIIGEIFGKQYKFIPGKNTRVFGNEPSKKEIEVIPLLVSEENGIKLGKPLLKEKYTFRVSRIYKGPKVSTRKFHAKANFRKTVGARANMMELYLDVKKAT
jgi:ribosomal protein L21